MIVVLHTNVSNKFCQLPGHEMETLGQYHGVIGVCWVYIGLRIMENQMGAAMEHATETTRFRNYSFRV